MMPKETPERMKEFFKEKIFVKDANERASMIEIVRFFEILLDPSHANEQRSDEPTTTKKDGSERMEVSIMAKKFAATASSSASNSTLGSNLVTRSGKKKRKKSSSKM